MSEIENKRPFMVGRVAKPGSTAADVPLVVACRWIDGRFETVGLEKGNLVVLGRHHRELVAHC
jgi:hypothetical protein